MGGSPSIPPTQASPPPPALPTDPAILEARRRARRRTRGRSGFQSTILTDQRGLSLPQLTGPSLIGGGASALATTSPSSSRAV